MNSRLNILARQIADDAAQGTLIAETLPSSQKAGWMDTSEVPEEAKEKIAAALEYLRLRGLVISSESEPQLVQFCAITRPN